MWHKYVFKDGRTACESLPKSSGTVLALGTIIYKIIVGNVPDKLKERKKFKTAQSLEVLITGIILKREVEYSFNYIWLNRSSKYFF